MREGELQVVERFIPLSVQCKHASQVVSRGGRVAMPDSKSALPAFECIPVRFFGFRVALFLLQEVSQTIHGVQGIVMIRAQCSAFRFERLLCQLLGLRVLALRSKRLGQVSHGDQRGTMFWTKQPALDCECFAK